MTDIALLDGGVGQEIQKRSMTKAHPLWSVKVMFDQPDIVTKVHRDFIMSGTRVISLNTYAASKSRMIRHGFGDKLEVTHKTAINLAKHCQTLPNYPAQLIVSCNTNRLMLYVCLIKQTNSSDAKNCDEIYSYKLLTFNLDLQITNETPI